MPTNVWNLMNKSRWCVWGRHYEDYSLLRCDALQFGISSPTKSLLPPSSGVMSRLTTWQVIREQSCIHSGELLAEDSTLQELAISRGHVPLSVWDLSLWKRNAFLWREFRLFLLLFMSYLPQRQIVDNFLVPKRSCFGYGQVSPSEDINTCY
jgi:hypothetical protein